MSPQAQLVYEAGQIKGSIAMSHPDRLHSHGQRGDLCYGNPHSNRGAEHLLEIVRHVGVLRFNRQRLEVAQRGVLSLGMCLELKAVHRALAMRCSCSSCQAQFLSVLAMQLKQ